MIVYCIITKYMWGAKYAKYITGNPGAAIRNGLILQGMCGMRSMRSMRGVGVLLCLIIFALEHYD